MSVDFYNHDSKETDKVVGFEPVVNTLFSFKNPVDSFYVKYLENEVLHVDVMALAPGT